MADLKSEKNVWMNKLRQTKEYKLSDQGGTYNVPYKGADAVPEKEHLNKYLESNFSNYDKQEPKDDIEATKALIVNTIKDDLFDMLFTAVNEEMRKYYVFQEDHYLTEAGSDWFEDEWFQFYHEHHGDILGAIMKSFTN